jgi:hypothetical protein
LTCNEEVSKKPLLKSAIKPNLKLYKIKKKNISLPSVLKLLTTTALHEYLVMFENLKQKKFVYFKFVLDVVKVIEMNPDFVLQRFTSKSENLGEKGCTSERERK